jgi:hypothetical protein
VRVPDGNRIGAVGEGWRVSLTTLMNERNAIGSGSAGGGTPRRGGAANDAVQLWQSQAEADRRAVDKDRLMQLWVQAEVARLTNLRAAQNARAGNPGPEMSIAKLAYSELNKALYDFTMNLLGAQALIDFDYTFRRPDDLDDMPARNLETHTLQDPVVRLVRHPDIVEGDLAAEPGKRDRVGRSTCRGIQRSRAGCLEAAALRRSGEAQTAVDREVDPVTYVLLIRNRMPWAISSGRAMRPSGVRFACDAITASRRSPAIWASIGVSTMPGRMMFTRIGASSRATTRARISAPPAAAATMAPPRRGRATPTPVQMVMEPSVIFGAAYRQM